MQIGLKQCLFALTLSLIVVPLHSALPGGEKERFRYRLKQAPAIIRVEGQSTLGQWDCTQHEIDGLAELNVSALQLGQKVAGLLGREATGRVDSSEGGSWQALESKIQVAIDATAFDCDNKRMERDLADAIKADKYPKINYHFTGVKEVSVKHDAQKGSYLQLKVAGELLFGGERRATEHLCRLWLSEGTTIEIEGQLDLEMSEFGIEPPSALFGLIKAKNRFQVGYHIKLETEKIVSEVNTSA